MNAHRPALMLAVAACVAAAAACGDRREGESLSSTFRMGNSPDELPEVVNAVLPFRYPGDLYAHRVQGNVTLRLYVDREGRVLPESTSVEESSGYIAFDSAAIKGSHELEFRAARRRGEPIGVVVHFPVYFRHPEVRGLPGDDTILQKSKQPR
jgi:TonB family protein